MLVLKIKNIAWNQGKTQDSPVNYSEQLSNMCIQPNVCHRPEANRKVSREFSPA